MTGELDDVLICQCEECRRWHGHASATTATRRENLVLLETISLAAGTLDGPTGLHAASHWYVSQAGDYYEVPDDGLPHHQRRGEGELS